jgi:hypothetical protein
VSTFCTSLFAVCVVTAYRSSLHVNFLEL